MEIVKADESCSSKPEIRNLKLDLSPERDFLSILRFRDFGFEVQDSFVFEISFAGC